MLRDGRQQLASEWGNDRPPLLDAMPRILHLECVPLVRPYIQSRHPVVLLFDER